LIDDFTRIELVVIVLNGVNLFCIYSQKC